jgi:hypothetical protein
VRKGFYFSFDALLAMTVLSLSLVIVSQSGGIVFDDYRASEIEFQKSSTAGQDVMRLASSETFRQFNSSFQQELVDETVMEEEDLDRTVLDGVSLLWAARNITHARTATEAYFSGKLDSEYRLEIAEGGDTTEVYQTSDTFSSAETVSSSARLVSGHSIDQPSKGFQARARAVEATTNQTKITNIPMMGSGAYTNNLEVNRSFYVPAKKIHGSNMYISMQWGQSNFDSATLEINGETAIDESDMVIETDGKAHYGFGKVDVTEHVEKGWNEFSLVFPNQDSNNDYHAHIQPGTRIETVYTQDIEKVKSRDWHYMADLKSGAQNANQKGGVWYNFPVQVPGDANVSSAVLELDIRNLENHRSDDLQVYVNDQRVLAKSADNVDSIERVEFSDYLESKTNVLSIYGNVELDDGKIVGFTHTGQKGDGPRIYSDPVNEEGSRVNLSFDKPGEQLEFGLIEIRWTNEIGSGIEEPLKFRSNPAYFNQTFDEKFEIINTFLNVAQLNSINVTHRAGIDSQETVFQSPRTYATPSRIETGANLVEGGRETEYWYEDTCNDGVQRSHCEVLPESSLEVEIGLPSQVGYGRMFDNKTDAVADAEQRLQDQLGQFADATNIEDDTVSTGGQPYLWGPATVRLVIWDD